MDGVKAEIGLCLLLAAADGEISDEELFALTTRVGSLLGDDFPLDRLGALVEGELAAIEEEGADAYVARLAARIEPDRRAEAVRGACKVACADGLSPEEDEMLREACAALDIDVETLVEAVGHRATVRVSAPDPLENDDEPDELGT